MRFRENSKRLIALLLALITVLSLPLSAGAISYDGSGTSGGGNASSSGNGTFGIARSDVKYDLIGYCFTGINAQGERAGDTLSLGVNELVYLHATKKEVSRLPRTDGSLS